jgi:hypothetical protein
MPYAFAARHMQVLEALHDVMHMHAACAEHM